MHPSNPVKITSTNNTENEEGIKQNKRLELKVFKQSDINILHHRTFKFENKCSSAATSFIEVIPDVRAGVHTKKKFRIRQPNLQSSTQLFSMR